MNGKTAKLLRQVERAHRVHDAQGKPYSVDVDRTARGRETLSHRDRGRQTAWLQRKVAGR